MKCSIKELFTGRKVTINNMKRGTYGSMRNGSWSLYGEVYHQQQQFNTSRVALRNEILGYMGVCVWAVATIYLWSLTGTTIYDY